MAKEEPTVLTVKQLKETINYLPDDVEIDFGSTPSGKKLVFYRFKSHGEKFQIELNEADLQRLRDKGPH